LSRAFPFVRGHTPPASPLAIAPSHPPTPPAF
jgi:hypothetical protein